VEKEKGRDSDDETERGVSEMLKAYDLGTTEREDSISPPKLELISQIRPRYSIPSSYNGHPQCLLPACASLDAG